MLDFMFSRQTLGVTIDVGNGAKKYKSMFVRPESPEKGNNSKDVVMFDV